LSTHIVSTFLIDQGSDTSYTDSPAIFLLCPPTAQTTLSLLSLLNQRLQSMPSTPQPAVEALLNKLQVHPYLSLGGLTESVSDVASSLFTASRASVAPQPAIILLQGLSALLADTLQRREPSSQAVVVASNMLRSLKHLSRTHCNLLVLVELEMETRVLASGRVQGPHRTGGDTETGLTTAFSSLKGEALFLRPVRSVISDVLEQALDVMVGVHDGFGKTVAHDKREAKKGPGRGHTSIVEVLKDDVGPHFGEWSLWIRSP
jgi:hypothetical protein